MSYHPLCDVNMAVIAGLVSIDIEPLACGSWIMHACVYRKVAEA